jgi:hypothetical protein
MSVRRRIAWPFVLALVWSVRAHGAPCPEAGIVTVVADDRSADGAVQLTVSGSRVSGAGACDPTGTGLATSYATTVACTGAGASVCGRIGGLAPGLWIHRVSLQVSGSALQLQSTRSVVVAGATTSNVVRWTVFGRTFVVTQATNANLRAQLDAARAYTQAEAYPALVRFSHATFPGAASPVTIALQSSPSCALATCADTRETAYCFEGEDVTVDALDDDGLPGGVKLTVGTCDNGLLRLYGTNNVLRGLVFEGVTDPMATIAVDTVAIAGLATGGNRLEQCTVLGPTKGDAVSVEGNADQPGSGTAPENAIVGSEVTGAADKGIKIDFGGVLRLERSCVHDNRNGGVQVTLGGTATAIENVVQHNVGGAAGNGIFAGVPNVQDSQFPNVLTTRGNVVRFNGARGVSIVNNATASLEADVVTDNYRAGLRVETLVPGITPTLTVRGATFACNYAQGICLSQSQACRLNEDCDLQVCNQNSGTVTGVGLALDLPCAGCELPVVDLGIGGLDSGHNAFTANANPLSNPPGGVNLMSELATASAIPAAGNQWEHCDPPDPLAPNKCNVAEVASSDIRLGAGATPLFLGTPTGPRHGPAPAVTAISPSRPRAGELVRVYGGNFNAIDGAACHEPGVPADRCSIENVALADQNAADISQGNHVTVTIDGVDYPAAVHQVTPAMLVFAMPVDCWAPGTLTVARGNDVPAPVALCDPAGCADGPAGTPCDDHDVCTLGEICLGDGTCVVQSTLDCTGPCLTGACDPITGCIPRDATTTCDDGDACTLDDHCSGTGASCVPGAPRACDGDCVTGACDATLGCLVEPATASCSDGDACTGDDHCSGVDATCTGSPVDCDDHEPCTIDECDATDGCRHTAHLDGTTCPALDLCRGPATCRDGVCDPGRVLACDDGQACTDDGCETLVGCTHVARTAIPGVVCHVTQLRTLVATMPPDDAALAGRLGARLDCVEQRLTAAEAAGTPRARKRAMRRARRCLVRFLGRVERARQLDEALRDELTAEAERGRAALDAELAG